MEEEDGDGLSIVYLEDVGQGQDFQARSCKASGNEGMDDEKENGEREE
jgi:hypothetical protein